jgi:polyisoprenyl-teichoic acid--peptidoglycan teichoic acid transferase
VTSATPEGGQAGMREILRSPRNLAAAGVVALVAIAGVVGLLGIGQTPPPVAVNATPPPLPTAAPSLTLPSPSPEPSPTPLPPGADPLLGLDGRFTILLLGSDFRGSSPGNRTDTIMIVSVVPGTGAVSAVSIPRDTAQFPLPTGKVWGDKLNALYPSLIHRYGRDRAGTELRGLIGGTLDVEIDAYALIGMVGLTTLIDKVGGVDVYLDAPVRDPIYWTNEGVQGIYFPAGENHLNGERALIFARTRKGDSDFQRVRRQQQLVEATVKKVLSRGLGALPALLEVAQKWIITDVPITRAPAIFGLVATADFANVRRAVLGPKFADPIPGTVDYRLRLDKVRALIADWFAPVAGSPAASQSP